MPQTCLFAPGGRPQRAGDNRRGIVLAVCICTSKPILAATPARSISLASVNGASLSETKVKADLAPRFSTRSARNSSPSSREVTPVTICRELSDSDQIIKSEHGGTDPRLKKQNDLAAPVKPPNDPRPVQHGGRVGVPQTCLFAPGDDRNALATTAGGIVLAVCICTLKPIWAATPARSISLASVNGASLSETKVKADLAPRFSARSARKSILEQSENYTVSRSAAN